MFRNGMTTPPNSPRDVCGRQNPWQFNQQPQFPGPATTRVVRQTEVQAGQVMQFQGPTFVFMEPGEYKVTTDFGQGQGQGMGRGDAYNSFRTGGPPPPTAGAAAPGVTRVSTPHPGIYAAKNPTFPARGNGLFLAAPLLPPRQTIANRPRHFLPEDSEDDESDLAVRNWVAAHRPLSRTF